MIIPTMRPARLPFRSFDLLSVTDTIPCRGWLDSLSLDLHFLGGHGEIDDFCGDLIADGGIT